MPGELVLKNGFEETSIVLEKTIVKMKQLINHFPTNKEVPPGLANLVDILDYSIKVNYNA